MKSGLGRKGVVLVVLLICGSVYGKPWPGSGDANDPYRIHNAEQMQAIGADANYWGAHFRLMKDIDLGEYTGTSFNIIGVRFVGSPYGITLDTTAVKMYWTDNYRQKICRANIDGTKVEDLITTDLRYPSGITIDESGGKIYWTDHGMRKIWRANLDGTGIEELVTEDLVYPRDIDLDTVSGKMYWTDYGTDKICRANLDGTGVEDLVTTGLVYPAGIALDTSGGKMYWTDSGTDKIQRANLDGTGVEDLVTTGLSYPTGISLDTGGGKIYWTDSSAGKIQRANLDGTGVEDLVTTGLINPIDIVLDTVASKMYWTDTDTDKIQWANLDGTGVEDVLSDRPFAGVFDGNNHTISNFTYDSNGINYVGLFSYINDPNAEVKDLGLTEPDVNGGNGSSVGALAGYIIDGTISGCSVEGGSVSGNANVGTLVGLNKYGDIQGCSSTGGVSGVSEVGGLVGLSSEGTIQECHSTGSVSGDERVGGLVGRDSYGTISNCYVESNVSGSESVGGLVGYNNNGSISVCRFTGSIEGYGEVGGMTGYGAHTDITECYADGSILGTTAVGGLVGTSSRCYIKDCYNVSVVEGVDDIGGLVGYAVFENSALENSYAAGNVSGEYNCGGLIGRSYTAVVSDCYWDVEAMGQLSSSGGGVGKSTVEMQDSGTYIGWGCEPRWTIDDGNDYPRLAWQNEPGTSIAGGVPWSGDGTESEPYLVYTAEQFNSIGLFECEWDKHFKLMADVDIGCYTGAQFNIIGHIRNTFTGVFDGDGKRILDFTYDVSGRGYNGIFGSAGNNTVIMNVTMVNPDINIDELERYNGALIGRIGGDNSIVRNCHVTNGVIVGGPCTGGLIGKASIKILQCSTTCDVYGWEDVGGLVGEFSNGTISECAATGDITGVYTDIGGLLGSASNWATIKNSYARGNVTGGNIVAGLIGDVWDYWYAVNINKCYSTGMVQGGSLVGGLVNEMYRPFNVTYSFWDIETSGTSYSGAGTGKTTAQMQTRSTFTWAGWDFVGETTNGTEDMWDICEGTNYPKFVWQIPLGDFMCPDGVDMFDFGVLGDAWMSGPGDGHWDAGCDISEPNDNVIDGLDLEVFVGNWLEGL